MSLVDVVVMAGGSALSLGSSAPYKELIPLGGKPMIAYVIEALRAAETTGKIVVTAPTLEGSEAFVDLVDELVITTGSITEKGLTGVSKCSPDALTLVCTGDLPLLTPEAVDSFVREAQARGGDFTYPLISSEAIKSSFPDSKRTYFKLAEGEFTGGNIFLIQSDKAPGIASIAQDVFELRKNPAKIAKYASLSFMMKLARGKLTFAGIEDKASSLLGGAVAIIETDQATLGNDVDKPADLELARSILGS